MEHLRCHLWATVDSTSWVIVLLKMWYFQLHSDNIMNSIFWSFVSCPQDRDCYSAKSFLNVSALSHLKVSVLQCFYKIIFPWVNPILLAQSGAWSIRYNPSIICHNFFSCKTRKIRLVGSDQKMTSTLFN